MHNRLAPPDRKQRVHFGEELIPARIPMQDLPTSFGVCFTKITATAVPIP